MNPFYVFLCFIIAVMLFLCGVSVGTQHGKEIGATAQKNGQITWHTNTTSTVSFTVNK